MDLVHVYLKKKQKPRNNKTKPQTLDMDSHRKLLLKEELMNINIRIVSQ